MNWKKKLLVSHIIHLFITTANSKISHSEMACFNFDPESDSDYDYDEYDKITTTTSRTKVEESTKSMFCFRFFIKTVF